jgi:hypothetical protein
MKNHPCKDFWFHDLFFYFSVFHHMCCFTAGYFFVKQNFRKINNRKDAT